MQLKRDTEYALRIMLCIAEELQNSDRQKGFPSTLVLEKTAVPLVSFYRICRSLEANGLICNGIKEDGVKWIYPGKDFWSQNILSIGEAIEGTMMLFAVFDKNSYFTQAYGEKLKDVQNSLNEVLSKTTISELINEY